MSEYQYYEFQAIDRPLDRRAQDALRSISSRARITATSFTNHYEWGDFKGDPSKLMERWFDLHLYLANWGTRRLMMRLPKRFLSQADIDPFLREIDWAEAWISGDHLIVDIHREEEPGDDWDDGSGHLAALAPLRADVVSGDLRLFYLLWLTAAEEELVPDEEAEPLPGIGPLTEALEAFAEFFGIDADLVAAAAESGNGDLVASKDALREGLAAHLRRRAQEIGEERERAEARRREAERRQKTKEAETARRARLDALKRRGAGVWLEIEEEIGRRNASGYDRAVNLLADLEALAAEEGSHHDFCSRLAAIRARHGTKVKLIERLSRLGQSGGK